jgi:hypothetical protein
MTTTGTQMRTATRLIGLIALVAGTVSCGDVIRQGRSPGVLVMNSLLASSGGGHAANTLGTVLNSDVVVLLTSPDPCTITSPCPVTFSDTGSATIGMAMKDITVAPTTNNQVTLTRYRVSYRRNDGRNNPGVDVPLPFDGVVTVTVQAGGTATVAFDIVRLVAKRESPLIQLISDPNVLLIIADVTFFGKDLVGNDISVTGSIQINFANFVDT